MRVEKATSQRREGLLLMMVNLPFLGGWGGGRSGCFWGRYPGAQGVIGSWKKNLYDWVTVGESVYGFCLETSGTSFRLLSDFIAVDPKSALTRHKRVL